MDPIISAIDPSFNISHFIKALNLQKKRPILVHINKEILKTLVTQYNYKSCLIGHTHLVDLKTFNPSWSSHPRLKKNSRKAKNKGVSIQELNYKTLCQKQIKQLQDDWLHQKRGPKHFHSFINDPFSYKNYKDIRYFAAFKDKNMIAIRFFTPQKDPKDLLAQNTFYKKDSPNGTNAYLLSEALLHFKKEGFKSCDLGLAPLDHLSKKNKQLFLDMLQRLAKFFLIPVYDFDGVNLFKAQFKGKKEPCYLAYTGLSPLWPAFKIILKTFGLSKR